MLRVVTMLVVIVLGACGDFVTTQPGDTAPVDSGPDNGAWAVECFPDAGMCRAFRWEHEVTSMSCDLEWCWCHKGTGDEARTTKCGTTDAFKPTPEAGLREMLRCCF